MRDVRRLLPYSTLTILPPVRAMNLPRTMNQRNQLLQNLYDRFTCFDSLWPDLFGWIGDHIVGCSWSRYHIGLVPGIRGLAFRESPGGLSSLNPSTVVHELSHALGRAHAGNSHGESTGGGWDSRFPFPHGGIGGYGFDINNWQVVRPTWGSAGPPAGIPLSPNAGCDPDDTDCPTHDYLSYGDGPRWPSSYTWNNIWRHGFTGRVGSIFGGAGAGVAAEAEVSTPELVHIRGHLAEDGTLVTESYYTFPTPKGAVLPEANGDLHAAAVDANGKELSSRDVEPLALEDSEEALFSFLLPFPAETATIRLSYRGEVVDERAVSASPPTLSVVTPSAGAVVSSGEVLRIQWNAIDTDGDPMTYSVQYSADKGQTWLTLGTGLEETSLEVETRALPGSPDALVRVMASDGVLATRATSALFELQDQPPYAVILWPEDGASLSMVDPHIFQGSVADPEENEIEDETVGWFSDVQGFLGKGRSIDVKSLKEGRHEITLKADDLQGITGSRTIEIFAVRSGPPSRNFVRGDVTDDGTVDMSDAIALLGYLFLGAEAPECEDAGDTNDDGELDISDAIQILGYLFLGDNAPQAPFPEAGVDTTEDELHCPES